MTPYKINQKFGEEIANDLNINFKILTCNNHWICLLDKRPINKIYSYDNTLILTREILIQTQAKYSKDKSEQILFTINEDGKKLVAMGYEFLAKMEKYNQYKDIDEAVKQKAITPSPTIIRKMKI